MGSPEYALQFAERGWYVFPLRPNSKVTYKDFTWSSLSSDSVSQVKLWIKNFPDCNWGLDCGKSSITVLDIDNKEGKKGSFELDVLEMDHGEIDKSFAVETTTGGFQYYFDGSGKNTASYLAVGIDTRGKGGMVVIPGSTINGKPYKLLSSKSLPALPAWLKQKFSEKDSKIKKDRAEQDSIELDKEQNIELAIDFLKNRAAVSVEGQGGDETAFKVACAVRDFGISENVAIDIMSAHWNCNCKPPWSEEELCRKVENAYQYAQSLPGQESPENDFPNDIKDVITREPGTKTEQKTNISDIFLPIEQFTKIEFPPRRVFLDPWVSSQTISLVYGDAGTGKTWFLLSVLRAISLKEDFGPWQAVESVPVAYLDAEMTGFDVQDRLSQLDLVCAKDFFIYSDALAHEKGLKKANILDESWRESYGKALINRKIKLSVLDNLASLSPGGDENTKEDWNPVNQWLIDLRYHGISTILLHHTNKAGGQRGTSARIDNVDFAIRLKKPGDYRQTDGARFDLEFEKRRLNHEDLRKLANIQMQLIQEGDKATWQFINTKKVEKHDILRMKSEGLNNKEIAEEIGCSAANITKWVKKLKADGYLSDKGDLTAAGLDFLAQTADNLLESEKIEG